MIKDYSNNEYKSKIRIKKDYKKKKFVNPYFEHKKEKVSGFNTKLYLKIIAGVFLVYVLIYSDLFKIDTVEITGTDMIDHIEIEQQVNEQISSWRWFILPQKNLIFMSKRRLSQKINEKYKLETLEIDKGWKKLRINVVEKINFLIIYNNEKFFFADEEGTITREITQDEATSYWGRFPILNIYRDINVGDSVTSAKTVDFILRFNEKIQETDIEFHGYESNGESEVTLVTKVGWRAHLDTNSDIDINIENMQLVLDEKVEDQSKLEYIDLRFGNKVFYK